MDRKHVKSQLPAYLSGGLPYEERRDVDVHLAECPRCQRWLADLRSKQSRLKREALKRAAPEPMPNLLLARLRQQTEMTPPGRRSRIRWLGLAFILAGIGGVALKNNFWSSPSHHLTPVPLPDTPQVSTGTPTVASDSTVVQGVSSPVASSTTTPVSHAEKSAAEKPPVVAATIKSPAAPPPAAEAPPPEMTSGRQWRGTYCLVKDYREIVIRDSASWRALWDEMGQYGDAPRVNFNRWMVVGVLMGEKPGTGYDVTVSSPTETAQDVAVSYKTTEPAPGSVTGDAVTHPFHLMVITRTDKPIRFVKSSS